MDVQLLSPVPDQGFAYNQGIYWPVGLLTIGSVLRRSLPSLDVQILDEAVLGRDEVGRQLRAPIVGIQASSCLSYGGVIRLARLAKARGATVIVGGAHASEVPEQILLNRPDVDYVVVGSGEHPMIELVRRLTTGGGRSTFADVPGVWQRNGNAPLAPSGQNPAFDYELAQPLDYSLVDIPAYHANYRQRLNPDFVGSFQIFTHFGCRYRESRRRAGREWCSYCALGAGLVVRDIDAIVQEIRRTLKDTGVPLGSRVILKCYGDNASALAPHLDRLAAALDQAPDLHRFDLRWSMYGQSSMITPRLIEAFRRLRVHEVYVGFDSVDDHVQRINHLGTTRATHVRAARLLASADIGIHAGFVVGCEGESPATLKSTIEFAEELAGMARVDMFHASPLVVLPGSPAFQKLVAKEPCLSPLDLIDTQAVQKLWLKHFCPQLGSPACALKEVERTARTIEALGRIPSSFGGWRERDSSGTPAQPVGAC